MNKNACKKISLNTGEMHVYDFGSVKLHAYKTNDPIDNEVFILEKGGKAVVIEAPCFFSNIAELTAYLKDGGMEPIGLLLAYHMAGASFLPGVPVYSTKNADEYGHSGGGAALIRRFAGIFADAFDASIYAVTNYVEDSILGSDNPTTLSLAGIDFAILPTRDAFDIEIPEINAVYTHMLGHDCHSIVAGAAHADGIIAQLEGYIAKGVDLILTSHYTPEDLKDASAKIAYLKELKAIAARNQSAEAFKSAVLNQYKGYTGENYLDMTAGFFFG